MTAKRPRAAFEADLLHQSSPFVTYGTPLPPLDSESRDDGSYVPVWKQTVTDDRGRKRLHGAFTGGFSAGYFNTVGSKEGWSPSTFVSSRSNRHHPKDNAHQQRPEDFMDEEDLAEAAEAQNLHTARGYSALGSSAPDNPANDNFFGLIMAEGETMGVKLLQKMGWRRGQGIGPRVRRRARLDQNESSSSNKDHESEYLFAPKDTPIISFERKEDHKGLGYQSEAKLFTKSKSDEEPEPAELNDRIFGRNKAPGEKPLQSSNKRTGFGSGILNDDSDDEDPYEMGPKIKYNRSLGSEKKTKKLNPKSSNSTANPLLAKRPVFVSRKDTNRGSTSLTRTCHDGRLPLNGFVLAVQLLNLSEQPSYPLPKVPTGWKSSKIPQEDPSSEEFKSVADAARSSTLDAKSRAAMLGETPLPGKSVFDYVSKAARDRLAAVSGKADLPQGRGEAPPQEYRQPTANSHKDLQSLVPYLSKETAQAVLNKNRTGVMPYSDDPQKRTRFTTFLEISTGSSHALPHRPAGVSVQDWIKELQEFVRTAQIFKPASGLMAARFTSSRSDGSPNTESNTNTDRPLHTPKSLPEDPAVQAAKLGMFGPMTRTTRPWAPTRLLCKRFGISPPSDVALAPEETTQEAVSKSSMEAMLKEASLGSHSTGHTPLVSNPSEPIETKLEKVDVETNDALEAKRAGQDVFKAIFGSDDED